MTTRETKVSTYYVVSEEELHAATTAAMNLTGTDTSYARFERTYDACRARPVEFFDNHFEPNAEARDAKVSHVLWVEVRR